MYSKYYITIMYSKHICKYYIEIMRRDNIENIHMVIMYRKYCIVII